MAKLSTADLAADTVFTTDEAGGIGGGKEVRETEEKEEQEGGDEGASWGSKHCSRGGYGTVCWFLL